MDKTEQERRMADTHIKMCGVSEEKILDADNGIVEHYVSAHQVDVDFEVVWLLDAKISPTLAVLTDHGFSLRGRKPIGGNQSLDLVGGATDAKLKATTKFALYDEEASILFRMHQDGFIKGWSIGYRVGEYLWDADARKFLVDNGWTEKEALPVRAVHNKIYIKEYSSTALPANEGAVDIQNQVNELVAKSASYSNLAKELELIRADIKALQEGHTLKGSVSDVLFPHKQGE